MTCQGHWRESSYFLRLTEKTKFRSRGARKWLTHAEISQKYGSSAIADAIVDAKENGDDTVKKNQIREHKDCAASWLHC